MPTLDGLTKYAHLIDVDYFADDLQVTDSFSNLHAPTHCCSRDWPSMHGIPQRCGLLA